MRQERERQQVEANQKAAVDRGSYNAVTSHYNAVPQRDRTWRQTASKIKNLRTYNNWVKSTLIQKFSPDDSHEPGAHSNYGPPREGLKVLDLGCGKGGDLQKWLKAPQKVDLYIGVDPAEISIQHARERYRDMRNNRNNRGPRVFHAEFFARDGFGEWLGDVSIIRDVGIDGDVGPGGGHSGRWAKGGFDVVSMMFCLHYAFESEEKARGMLRNVAGALKKGGKLIGAIPNSDVIRSQLESHYQKQENEPPASRKLEKDEQNSIPISSTHEDASNLNKEPAPTSPHQRASADAPNEPDSQETDSQEKPESQLEWGNSIYRVRFPGKVPQDGVFRPPFGWKYSFFLEEAVEEVPEYVVPWEAFRAMAEDYGLEMQYRKPFAEIWNEERHNPDLEELSVRMKVTDRRGGELAMSKEELEAASFYHAFCFYKV